MNDQMNEDAFRALDEYEQDIMDSIEKDQYIPVQNRETLIQQAKGAARSTLKKDKRMNIRISERDLKNLKIRALQEGIPYQTLVSMILHKYLAGRLKEGA